MRRVSYSIPEQMLIGCIASKGGGVIVADALYKPELAGQSFQISRLEDLNGSDLARNFSIGLGEDIIYDATPSGEFGDILEGSVNEEAVNGTEQYY